MPSGWGDWSPDVPNNATLQIGFWNEHEGDVFGAEFYSGRCEYPEVYVDLCQLAPTATPTIEVEELPVTGAAAPLDAFSTSWMTAMGLLLIASGGILRWLDERK